MLKRIFKTLIVAQKANPSSPASQLPGMGIPRVMDVCGLFALLLLSTNVHAQTPAPQNEFVIRNARIFAGSRVIPSGDVWVKSGMIEAVGPHMNVPPGIREIDASGRTLVPGLIDAHVHTMG